MSGGQMPPTLVTDALDVLGLLLLAAGLAGLLWTVLGAGALLPAGLVVLAGSHLIDHLARPKQTEEGTR